jgi:hypothetical protein
MGVIEYDIEIKNKKIHIIETYIWRIEKTLINGYDYNTGEKIFINFSRYDLNNYLNNVKL